MSTKIRRIEEVIGQTTAKNMLLNMLQNESIPDFLLFVGDSGSGKSTLAEWLALTTTCKEGFLNPCMNCEICQDNLNGLATTGKSMHIKKVNLAKIAKKTDIQEIIKEVFSLPPIADEEIFYIFEEIQALGENQDAFLEELDKIPEHVHVIGCGTDAYKLKETFLSRAGMVLRFNKLSTHECKLLINRKCEEFNIDLDTPDKLFLIHSARNNARTIVNTLENTRSLPDIKEGIRDLFSKINYKYYFEFLELCFKDYANFILGIDALETQINIQDFWRGFKSFIRESVFFYYGNSETEFTTEEQDKIYKIFKQINSSIKVQKIRKLSQTTIHNDEDVEIVLSDIREVVQAEQIDLKYSQKAEATSVDIPKLKDDSIKKEEPKQKMVIKSLSLDMLNDLTKNDMAYKKK